MQNKTTLNRAGRAINTSLDINEPRFGTGNVKKSDWKSIAGVREVFCKWMLALGVHVMAVYLGIGPML